MTVSETNSMMQNGVETMNVPMLRGEVQSQWMKIVVIDFDSEILCDSEVWWSTNMQFLSHSELTSTVPIRGGK